MHGNVAPQGLAAAYDFVRSRDPNHPVVIIQAPRARTGPLTTALLKPYAAAGDIHGVDIYPISHPPGAHAGRPNKDISVVGDVTDLVVQAAPGKQHWTTLQIAWSGVLPPAHVPIFPNAHQERFMAYQAIVAGATGLVFFGGDITQVAPGKVSFGSPAEVAQNGGIVVVEAVGRNFGYWHVAPAVQPGVNVPLHGLLGHVAVQPEDWGHVHFAESSHGPNGITYWNPLRAGALTPFFDYGPPVISAIVTSRPPGGLHGLVDLSVEAHDNTPIEVTQAKPSGWRGMPVTPARISWRLMRAAQQIAPWQLAFDHGISFHS